MCLIGLFYSCTFSDKKNRDYTNVVQDVLTDIIDYAVFPSSKIDSISIMVRPSKHWEICLNGIKKPSKKNIDPHLDSLLFLFNFNSDTVHSFLNTRFNKTIEIDSYRITRKKNSKFVFIAISPIKIIDEEHLLFLMEFSTGKKGDGLLCNVKLDKELNKWLFIEAYTVYSLGSPRYRN